MRDERRIPPDQLTGSPVMRAWEAERAALEPRERRHAHVIFLGATTIILGLVAAIYFGHHHLAPAMKAIKDAIKNLL